MKKRILISALIFGLTQSAQAADWQSLFNGKDLSGWKQLGGNAKYTVENGEIVGESAANTPNSFLTTEKNYSDFIFEAEIKIEEGLNSGIQFRSQSTKAYENGRVHGYQAEIDTSERQWSGGIYEEAKRGWLYNMTRNADCKAAFQNGAWNHYRIEAINSRIRTWVNNVPCSDLLDNEEGFKSGFIAFQVHSIKDDKLAGKTVRMRGPKVLTDELTENQWYMPTSVVEKNYQANTLSAKQVSEGWKLLWDGKTTKGWKAQK